MEIKDSFSETDSRLKLFASESEVFQFTAKLLTKIIETTVNEQENCNVIVAAGRSITKSLECLLPLSIDWRRVNWFLADERCVASDDPQRNDLQIQQVLQKTLGNTYGNVKSPRADINLEEAVKEYATRIDQINMFDFCLLGMGDDGHIASLLPGHWALKSTDRCCLVSDSPNPPSQRITLSMGTLRNTKNRIVVTTSATKRQAVREFRNNPQTPVRIFEPTVIVLDRAASQ
ncbi:MAG: 6-phosphogluconolactonase [Actinobacteria bacterium]|nr:6-phosphogluconolactonase [Actinomycetota bacterium]